MLRRRECLPLPLRVLAWAIFSAFLTTTPHQCLKLFFATLESLRYFVAKVLKNGLLFSEAYYNILSPDAGTYFIKIKKFKIQAYSDASTSVEAQLPYLATPIVRKSLGCIVPPGYYTRPIADLLLDPLSDATHLIEARTFMMSRRVFWPTRYRRMIDSLRRNIDSQGVLQPLRPKFMYKVGRPEVVFGRWPIRRHQGFIAKKSKLGPGSEDEAVKSGSYLVKPGRPRGVRLNGIAAYNSLQQKLNDDYWRQLEAQQRRENERAARERAG